MPTGPSQEEHNSLLTQLEERESRINQLQNSLNEINTQSSTLNARLLEKDSQINHLTNQIQSLQTSADAYQKQVNQLTDENAQLQAHIPGLQQQVQDLQQHNSMLQQQIGPLQAQITKLQEEVAYRDRRINELKEPKAVMPSSLAQGITAQTTPGYEPSSTYSVPQTPAPSPASPTGTGRRLCPNCGASGFAVKEVEDKSRIISYIPKPIYAKKLVCTKCGFEF
jgi:predicted nuclease with TOPRIM domain